MQSRQSEESVLGMAYLRLCVERTTSSWRDMFARGTVGANISAGITVALVAIPLNLALAIACDLPPAVGLTTGAIAGILGAFLGASAFQITGPEVALAPITLAIVSQHGLEGLIAITFLAGLMQIAFGALRLGRVVHAIPVPVVGGFLAAVGLLVFDSQLPRLLGMSPEVRLLSEIRDPSVLLTVSPVVAIVGIAVIGIVVLLPRHIDRLPAPLIGVAFATAPVVLFGADMPTVSSIEGGFPVPALPTLANLDLMAILPSAAALALLASTDSLLCAVSVDALTGGERTRSDQELVAQGIANLGSAFFGGMPVAAAVVRSSAAIEAGATTRLAAIVQSVVLGLVLVVLGGYVSYVPLVALAAVLLVVGYRLIQIRQLGFLWRVARVEAAIFIVTAMGILVADFVVGVLVGVIAALFHFAHQQRRALVPQEAPAVDLEASEKDGTRAVEEHGDPLHEPAARSSGTMRLEGPLFFGAQDRIADMVRDVSDSETVHLDLTGVTTIDTSGALALARALEELTKRGVQVRVAAGDVAPMVRWAFDQASSKGGKNGKNAKADAGDRLRDDDDPQEDTSGARSERASSRRPYALAHSRDASSDVVNPIFVASTPASHPYSSEFNREAST